MKIVLNSLFIILIFLATGFAQTWAPPGATWKYGYGVTIGGFSGNLTMTYAGNAIIQGIPCKRLAQNVSGVHLWNLSDTSNFFLQNDFFYESGDSLFYYFEADSAFHMLYNFNSNVGDSWEFPAMYCDSTIRVQVDSVSTEIINNDTLKKLVVTTSQSWRNGSITILEKIGPTSDFLFLDHNFTCLIDWEAIGPLYCYGDNDFATYQVDAGRECDFIWTSVEEKDMESEFLIYPNPAGETLTIEIPETGMDKFQIILFNLLGKEVLRHDLYQPTIELKDLTSGIYILMIQDENGTRKTKRIIKQ